MKSQAVPSNPASAICACIQSLIARSVIPTRSTVASRSKMASVWRTASRIRSTSVADLRPRSRVTIGSAETNFPAWGVPASVLLQEEEEAVGDPVGGVVVGRVVEGDLARREAIERGEQRLAEALHVADRLGPLAARLDVRGVAGPGDRQVLAGAADQEERGPGDARADDEREARIGALRRLPPDEQPEIDV